MTCFSAVSEIEVARWKFVMHRRAQNILIIIIAVDC